jgi:DNA-directed RNA polymerase sigma subunit (sigma70/sigma32)
VTRERVRQIEAEALANFARRCRVAGIDAADLAAALARRRTA